LATPNWVISFLESKYLFHRSKITYDGANTPRTCGLESLAAIASNAADHDAGRNAPFWRI